MYWYILYDLTMTMLAQEEEEDFKQIKNNITM